MTRLRRISQNVPPTGRDVFLFLDHFPHPKTPIIALHFAKAGLPYPSEITCWRTIPAVPPVCATADTPAVPTTNASTSSTTSSTPGDSPPRPAPPHSASSRNSIGFLAFNKNAVLKNRTAFLLFYDYQRFDITI